jgi:hypothetical protein
MIKVMIKPGWDANKRALIRGSWRQAEKAILAKSNPAKIGLSRIEWLRLHDSRNQEC